MARITYSALVTDLKGSIGGTTFQNNPSGAIARNKPKRRRSGSAIQQLPFIATRALINIWHSLKLSDQQLWQAYADTYNLIRRNGDTVVTTGFAWFISANWYSYNFSGTYIAVPNSYVLPSVPSNYSFSVTGAYARITLDVTDTDVNTYFLIYASNLKNVTTSNSISGFRFIQAWTGASKKEININDAYNNVFGFKLTDQSYSSSDRIGIYLLPFQYSSRVYRAKNQKLFSF